MAERTAWRICSSQRLVVRVRQDPGAARARSPARRSTTTCAPCRRARVTRHLFTADAPNQLWLADITEHWTGEGKLYLCAIKDVYSNRIVGLLHRLADEVPARRRRARAVAVARRGDVAGCILHTDRGSQFRSRKFVHALAATTWSARWAGSAPPATTPPWSSFFALLQKNVLDRPLLGHPRRAADRDRHLDRTDLPPPPPAGRPRPIDPHRVRDHHDHTSRSGCLTQPVTYPCSSPDYWLRVNSSRWAEALELERGNGVAVCDSDPLKLHYSWCLAAIGVAPWERFQLELQRCRAALTLALSDSPIWCWSALHPTSSCAARRRPTPAVFDARSTYMYASASPS